MRNVRSEAFCEKDVINLSDGARLGYVREIEFDVCDGKITAIVVPLRRRGLCRRADAVIPWERIRQIGEDVILVDAAGCLPPRRDCRKRAEKL